MQAVAQAAEAAKAAANAAAKAKAATDDVSARMRTAEAATAEEVEVVPPPHLWSAKLRYLFGFVCDF
jgi:hypothetical protein